MTRTRPARPSSLRLEYLEDRTTPSTFTVTTTLDDVTPANGKFSLREAISKANSAPGADVIVLPAGVFKITQTGAGENANLTGDFDITDAVTIQGAGAGVSIVDGQQLDRVFDVLGSGPSSIKAVFAGVTVRNGNVIGGGGGIQVGNADLVVRDSVVSGNRCSLDGGGISNEAAIGTGNVKVVRTTVALNVVAVGGGGLWVGGSSVLTAIDSTIRRNLGSGFIGTTGGGIFATTAMLTNCTVSGNSTTDSGGGIQAITATLTNCTVNGNSAVFSGGGIRATTATLTNCTISSNSAVNSGGGIFVTTATLTNCTVSGNSAQSGGGGIDASTATLTNCTVSGNSAQDGGGGIDAGTATLTNCTVSGNSAQDGGGGIDAGTATLTNCTVGGNTASSNGGGIFAVSTAILTNCTVSGNSAKTNGGGIDATTATLTNCTVSGNSAKTNGGGLFATTATLLNCTIAENSAHTGGGLFQNPGGTFSIKNTIVALNLTDILGSGPDVSGAFASQGHNLIGDGTGGTGFTNGTNGDIVGTSVNPIDPKLGPLQNNGGKTQTMALKSGSLAIDHGDNAGAPANDQRGAGFPRKKDGNFDGVAIVDIGAFEL